LWERVECRTGLKLPKLEHSGWTQVLLILSGVIVAMAPIQANYIHSESLWSKLGMALLGLCIGQLFIKGTPPLAVCLPSDVITAGDLAKNVLSINYSALLREVGHHNRKDLWDAYCAIVVNQLGVKPSQVLPDASFLDDLRVD